MARGVRWVVGGLVGVLAAAALAALAVPERVLPVLGLRRQVVLYFATPDDQLLSPEAWTVPLGRDTPLDRLRLLAEGPRDRTRLAPVIPPGARPLWVRIEGGVATANFNRALVDAHWGGTAAELMTVYGIVHTLSELPGVQRVRILVEGEAVPTLAGHVDLSEPLSADPALVRAGPPASSMGGAPRRAVTRDRPAT